MKENESRAWLKEFNQRIAKLKPEEQLLLDDFGMSLSILEAFKFDSEIPLVKYHLDRVGFIINYFTKQDSEEE